ncbi:MAG: hypothetical protein QMD36_06590 [Candidatus Aenigmarchaeota archaeon]|nr:hypothetical protein [Candidatus Aenigmarchaeota archaeon]
MKKIMYFLFAFSIISFNLMSLVISAFCCGPPGQRRCYASGVCCLQGTADEYWHPVSCRDFNVWVRPERMMFTLAAKTPVNLYVENKGAYTDSYIVDYEKIPNDPNIIVDLAGVTPTGSIAPGEIKKLYPRIAVLSTITSADVIFIVNSTQEPTLQKSATLHIIESDYPVSLSELNLLGLIEILVLVGVIYFLILIKKG